VCLGAVISSKTSYVQQLLIFCDLSPKIVLAENNERFLGILLVNPIARTTNELLHPTRKANRISRKAAKVYHLLSFMSKAQNFTQ
jgi:hypothetical protein